MSSEYSGVDCLVTGGASFIGSHLTESLVAAGANVIVLDDLSSGKLRNLEAVSEEVRFVHGDARDHSLLEKVIPDAGVVFHLAAVHGGRGFIDTYPQQVLVNLAIDQGLFSACERYGARMVVQASSACVYPTTLQSSSEELLLLREDSAGFEEPGAAFPDGAYGWTKLMGEFQLQQFCEKSDMTGRAARIFTAYGSRENESHAVVALVAKALLRMDPYEIWGDGRQTRNFTHVSDTVKGLMHLGADTRPIQFDAFNVGTEEHHRVLDVVSTILEIVGWRPEDFDFQTDRPVGVQSRAADCNKIEGIFGWKPTYSLDQGLEELVAWYERERMPEMTSLKLRKLLLDR